MEQLQWKKDAENGLLENTSAVYSYPQIFSIGLMEKMARERDYKVLVGEYYYRDTERGVAMAVD